MLTTASLFTTCIIIFCSTFPPLLPYPPALPPENPSPSPSRQQAHNHGFQRSLGQDRRSLELGEKAQEERLLLLALVPYYVARLLLVVLYCLSTNSGAMSRDRLLALALFPHPPPLPDISLLLPLSEPSCLCDLLRATLRHESAVNSENVSSC